MRPSYFSRTFTKTYGIKPKSLSQRIWSGNELFYDIL